MLSDTENGSPPCTPCAQRRRLKLLAHPLFPPNLSVHPVPGSGALVASSPLRFGLSCLLTTTNADSLMGHQHVHPIIRRRALVWWLLRLLTCRLKEDILVADDPDRSRVSAVGIRKDGANRSLSAVCDGPLVGANAGTRAPRGFSAGEYKGTGTSLCSNTRSPARFRTATNAPGSDRNLGCPDGAPDDGGGMSGPRACIKTGQGLAPFRRPPSRSRRPARAHDPNEFVHRRRHVRRIEDAVDRHDRIEVGVGEGECLQITLPNVGLGQPRPRHGQQPHRGVEGMTVAPCTWPVGRQVPRHSRRRAGGYPVSRARHRAPHP